MMKLSKLKRYCLKAAVLSIWFVNLEAAWADEGGTSFWLPGQYGSFAALAPEPGWRLALVTYRYSAQGSGSRPLGFGGNLKLGVDADYLGQFIVPSYTPDRTIWGARPSFSLAFIPAKNDVSANVAIGGTTSAAAHSVSGISDIYPTAQLFWNEGVHNWMAYLTGNIPVGSYDANRLSNLGLGHGAIDIGGAYTFLNPNTGWEFSATVGVTYNFKNSDTGYQNGIDAHLDVGVSKFVSDRMSIGLVGFAFQQLTADRGQNPLLGDFKGRTFGIGPQISYTFNVGGNEVFANLRGFKEFNVKNRVEGEGLMLTFSLPL